MSDHARPLNPRGRQAATAMRAAMQQLELLPDLVLVSTAKRTLQTLDALAPWSETPLVDPQDDLYLASADTLLSTIQATRETVRSLLVVAHNPGIHELAVQLAGAQPKTMQDETLRRLAEGYPSGALAEFTIPGPWGSLAPGGGRLIRFLCPRDLPGG